MSENVITSVDEQITVPFPKNQTQSHILIKRYHDLTNLDLSTDETKSSQRDFECNSIEGVFKQISQDEEKYSEITQDINNRLSNNVEFDNTFDNELLQDQIKMLQKLSTEQSVDNEDVIVNSKDDFVIPDINNFYDIVQYLNLNTVLLKNINNDPTVQTDDKTELEISKNIADRIMYLENLPANIGSVSLNDYLELNTQSELPTNIDYFKINAAIELKSLQLLTFQKHLRKQVIEKSLNDTLTYSPIFQSPLYSKQRRIQHIKNRTVVKHTTKLLEEIAEQRKQAQYKKIKIKHKEEMSNLLNAFGNTENLDVNRSYGDSKKKILEKSDTIRAFIASSNYHQFLEKEEQRRTERNAKKRLEALKMNDEEAYMKLIDHTKDTRITHLLKQTNVFLDSLADAVRAQQKSQIDEQNVNEAVDSEDDREKRDYYSAAHKIKETIDKQASILVGGTLKPYQLKGLEWMVSLYNNKLNGILADEMGLGKTIQSISLITYLYEVKKEKSPFLVIVPLSTITNWTLEFEKWAPSLNTVVYKGSPNQRKEMSYQIRSGNFDVVLTTYEYIIKDKALLARPVWAHMIIDEGHRMKNSQSKLSFTLSNYYKTKNRLILTGTPLQNNLPELWALLNFVLPKIFKSSQTFTEWFNTPFANSGTAEKLTLTEEETLLVIRRLHMVLRPFLLRRLKRDVEKDLPDKVEKVVKCKMSAIQKVLYSQMAKYNAFYLGENEIDEDGSTKKNKGVKGLNNRIMQLKKIVNHPFVFEEVEERLNPTKRWDTPLLMRTSGKFELLDRVLDKFKATGHRCLLFFQMTSVMNIMEDFLRTKNMKYMRLDGSTKADDRTAMLKEFNAPDSEYFCFLLSTRAGGLGLNLQTADTVIIYDSDWNPHQDLQAQDRAHRIGQKNEVRILRLITTDSVEEAILQRATQKLDIDGKVIQAGKFNNDSTNEERENFLKQLLDAEAQREVSQAPGRSADVADEDSNAAEDDDDDDAELNQMMARNEDERLLFDQMDKDRKQAAIDLAKQEGKTKPEPRLITNEELPEVFTRDVSAYFNPPEIEEVQGSRNRKKVRYDDGISETRWLRAIDNEEDLDEVIARAESRRNANGEDVELSDYDGEGDEDDFIPEEEEEEEFKPRKRGRQKKSVVDEDEHVPQPKKRGRKKKTVTIDNENDEDELEAVDFEPVKRTGRKRKEIPSYDIGEDDFKEPEPIKRRGPPPKPKATQGGLIGAVLEYLLPTLRKVKDKKKTYKLTDIFESLPDRDELPDYYTVIKTPVSFAEIIEASNNPESTLDEVKNLFDTMLENAQTFNPEGTWVYNDAEELKRVLSKEWSKVEDIYNGNI
ncbi:hypothetical protein ACO0OE_003275 [Hanseniaspora uvarum]